MFHLIAHAIPRSMFHLIAHAMLAQVFRLIAHAMLAHENQLQTLFLQGQNSRHEELSLRAIFRRDLSLLDRTGMSICFQSGFFLTDVDT